MDGWLGGWVVEWVDTLKTMASSGSKLGSTPNSPPAAAAAAAEAAAVYDENCNEFLFCSLSPVSSEHIAYQLLRSHRRRPRQQ